jgi:hypothetical protein
VDEQVRAVRIRVKDQRPITAVRGVVPPRIVLAALLVVSSLVPGLRVRREGDRSGEESSDSPV